MITDSENTIEAICEISPVMPVVKVPSAEAGVGVARALVRGGVPVIELTLRTDSALDAIRAITQEVPDIVVGAGTVTSAEQVQLAVDAGARFVVSPGSPSALQSAVAEAEVPALLGATTLSEMMQLADRGWTTMKFFPAEAAGGISYLSSVRGPLPGLRFCPTGGVNPANASDYLAQENVICVGGSWLTPRSAVESGDWHAIEQLAREASQLR